ncbi:MAG: hypothetical protein GY892_17720 [Shimia sp.]|nr:hypothetical protein [Shimia sp.]
MSHDLEHIVARSFEALESAELPEFAENNTPLVPGIYLSWDQKECDVQMALSRAESGLLKIAAQVEGAPRWMSLNITLGEAAFEAHSILGVIACLQGSLNTSLPMFIRSRKDEEVFDTRLREDIVVADTLAVRAGLHQMMPSDALVDVLGFHTLVVELPCQSFDLDLRDFRLFLLQSTETLMAEQVTLGHPV